MAWIVSKKKGLKASKVVYKTKSFKGQCHEKSFQTETVGV